MKKYYLPISGSNLGEYFSSALIVPQQYLNDPLTDFQSLRKGQLLLCEVPVQVNADCFLEILLLEEEIGALSHEQDHISSANLALPLTRVTAIYFDSRELMENTIGVAESSAFIPAHLIREEILERQNTGEIVLEGESFIDSDLQNSIDLYNRYLGGFAFMRFGGESYMNYSPHYFQTIGHFNHNIEKQYTENYPEGIEPSPFLGLFDTVDDRWKEIRSDVFGNTLELKQQLRMQNIPERSNLFKLKKTDRKQYYKAILSNYGPGSQTAKTTDALFNDILSNKIAQREYITILYGIHNGYRQFSRTYKLGGSIYHTKFKLDSKLDYYTIESIYQYVFQSKRTDKIDYIEDMLPDTIIPTAKFGFYKYNLLGKEIIYAKRPESKEEYISHFLNEKRLNSALEADKITSYISGLVGEIFTDFEDRLKEAEMRNLANIKSIDAINMLLKDENHDLFDEIDLDGDGILTVTEIMHFINKINSSLKNYQQKEKIIEAVINSDVIIPEEPDTSNDAKDTKETITETIRNLSSGDNEITQTRIVIEKILNEITIEELRKLAENNGVAKNKQEVKNENKQEYIIKLASALTSSHLPFK